MSLFAEWEVVHLSHKVNAYSEMLIRATKQYAALEEQRDELFEALRGLRSAFLGNNIDAQTDTMRIAHDVIAKVGDCITNNHTIESGGSV